MNAPTRKPRPEKTLGKGKRGREEAGGETWPRRGSCRAWGTAVPPALGCRSSLGRWSGREAMGWEPAHCPGHPLCQAALATPIRPSCPCSALHPSLIALGTSIRLALLLFHPAVRLVLRFFRRGGSGVEEQSQLSAPPLRSSHHGVGNDSWIPEPPTAPRDWPQPGPRRAERCQSEPSKW